MRAPGKPMLGLLLITVFVINIGVAQAQNDAKRGAEYARNAKELAKQGQWKNAFEQYSRAYELTRKSAYLKGMAYASQELGDRDRALHYYGLYAARSIRRFAKIAHLMAGLHEVLEEETRKRRELEELHILVVMELGRLSAWADLQTKQKFSTRYDEIGYASRRDEPEEYAALESDLEGFRKDIAAANLVIDDVALFRDPFARPADDVQESVVREESSVPKKSNEGQKAGNAGESSSKDKENVKTRESAHVEQ